jgi:type IX secretion system PorP/SprF family membrane protein
LRDNKYKFKLMRKVVIFLLVLFTAGMMNAQQEALYTQFMFNKLSLNPAFAGNGDALCFTGIVREHWIGFPGTSKVQALSVNFPTLANDRVGLGLNISRQSIGVQQKLTLEGAYAYRFPLAGGNFSMGISVSGRQYNSDFSDPDLQLIHPFYDDAAIEDGKYSKTVFNAGFGVYYNNDNFYIGAGIPRLIRADIDFSESLVNSIEVRHMYLMSGLALSLNNSLVFMPQVFVKFAENSPIDVDYNLGLELDQKYYGAMTIRMGGSQSDFAESIDLLLGLQLNRSLFLGMAYDITLSPIRKYESGSVEILLHYCFGKKEKDIFMASPRFF